MKTNIFLMTMVLLCINCGGENPPTINEKTPSTPIKNDQALTVHIDPETGEFVTPEEQIVAPEDRLAPSSKYSISHEGLEETPSPVPGGGTMVDLKGRFQSPLKTSIDSSNDIKSEIKIENKVIESEE